MSAQKIENLIGLLREEALLRVTEKAEFHRFEVTEDRLVEDLCGRAAAELTRFVGEVGSLRQERGELIRKHAQAVIELSIARKEVRDASTEPGCDCQQWPTHVSNECPVHNLIPDAPPEDSGAPDLPRAVDLPPGGAHALLLLLACLRQHLASLWKPTHRHRKRGSTYQVIGKAELQVAGMFPPTEGDKLTIYRAEDGTLWARPTPEFEDGRFEDLGAKPAGDPAGEPRAWIVTNGKEEPDRMYRRFGTFGPYFTTVEDHAVRFARRADAEMYALEGEGAWAVLPVRGTR